MLGTSRSKRAAFMCAAVFSLSMTPAALVAQDPTPSGEERKGSKVPPVGPPWVRDFAAAHRAALKQRKPIFVYSTKTYCPHCVVMERDLLADPKLSGSYDDVIWLYVFQDFSDSEEDRAARRITQRFGLTAWPMHLLVDPHTLEVVGDTGRSLDSFRGSVARAKIARRGLYSKPRAVAEIEALVDEIEAGMSPKKAEKLLSHKDPLVRFAVVEHLASSSPGLVAAAAPKLLQTPHDPPLRFKVLEVLCTYGDAKSAPTLHDLLANPNGSRNPNMLRYNTARALGRCGDEKSVAALRPWATSGDARNGLTTAAIKALASLAEAQPNTRTQVLAALRDALPTAPTTGDPNGRMKPFSTRGLAETAHQALQAVTGERKPFPSTYDAKACEQLRAMWR